MTNRNWIDNNAKVANINGNVFLGFAPPIGTIVPMICGFFTNNNNGGFTSPLFTNNIAQLKIFLSTYAPNWSVCDGSLLNDPESPVYDNITRYLPNLTDSRFLMGSTAAGTATNNNSGVTLDINTMPLHNHSINSISVAADYNNHNHGYSISMSPGGDHSHNASWNTIGDHSHEIYTYRLGPGLGSGSYASFDDLTSLGWYLGPADTYPGGNHTHIMYSTYGGSHIHNFPDVALGAVYTSGANSSGNHGHTGSISVNNSGSITPDPISILPQNLSCFYIMRVK